MFFGRGGDGGGGVGWALVTAAPASLSEGPHWNRLEACMTARPSARISIPSMLPVVRASRETAVSADEDPVNEIDDMYQPPTPLPAMVTV